jgi:phage N-6-adenine-methyltransferase
MNLNITTTPKNEQDCAQTPWWLFDAVQRKYSITFKLDVCANRATAKCAEYFSLQERGENSLQRPWSAMNWCNPPYSDIQPWVEKAAFEAGIGNTTVMLIPDKPEVGWMRHARSKADTVVHMTSRIKFIRPNGEPFLDSKGKEQGPKFPVCLVFFTPHGLTMNVRDTYLNVQLWRDIQCQNK